MLKDLSDKSLSEAKEVLIELLCLYVRQEDLFQTVPFWQKRAQFLSVIKTKSVLDNQDPEYMESLTHGARTVDYESKRHMLNSMRLSGSQVTVSLEKSAQRARRIDTRRHQA